MAVLPAGEEAVAGGTEALVAALSVLAGVLAQVPHPALVQVWASPGVGAEAETLSHRHPGAQLGASQECSPHDAPPSPGFRVSRDPGPSESGKPPPAHLTVNAEACPSPRLPPIPLCCPAQASTGLGAVPDPPKALLIFSCHPGTFSFTPENLPDCFTSEHQKECFSKWVLRNICPEALIPLHKVS